LIAEKIEQQANGLPGLRADAWGASNLLLSTPTKNNDISWLHPPQELIPKLWAVFIDRVDPVVKIMHRPTFYASLMNGVQNLQSVSRPFEALMFAFYVTTIASLNDDEFFDQFGEQRSITLARYRIGAKQALANAEFIRSSSLTTLQAFIMFIVSKMITQSNQVMY
jgi:hypothetical protein